MCRPRPAYPPRSGAARASGALRLRARARAALGCFTSRTRGTARKCSRSSRTRSSRPCRKSCLTNRPRLPRRGKARTLRRARTSRQRPTPEAASTFGDKVNNSPSASREGSVRQTRAGNGGLLVAAAPAVGVCRKIQHLIERPALAIGGEGKTARCALLAFGSLHRHP